MRTDDGAFGGRSHRWETDWCPRCKERTTFWLKGDRISSCALCNLEKDRGAGLNLDSSIFQTH